MAFRIEFFVNDIEKSVVFYQNLLGLELAQQGENSASFISDESYLLLTYRSWSTLVLVCFFLFQCTFILKVKILIKLP